MSAITGLHICFGGEDRRIMVGGVEYLFEDHPYCGPMPLNKKGGERHIGPRHAFWTAVTQWYAGGKTFYDNGLCAWQPEPNTLTEHISGRHHRVVGEQQIEAGPMEGRPRG